jgi:hypothetical protein
VCTVRFEQRANFPPGGMIVRDDCNNGEALHQRTMIIRQVIGAPGIIIVKVNLTFPDAKKLMPIMFFGSGPVLKPRDHGEPSRTVKSAERRNGQRGFTNPVGTCSGKVRLPLALRSRSRSRACSSSAAAGAAWNLKFASRRARTYAGYCIARRAARDNQILPADPLIVSWNASR